jgi:alpha-amylase/alpha-mannosidase (GH57 family)
MGRKPLCVAILWHMHQPDYGNEMTGEIYLPWTRFHAIKDYYDMGALAAEVPGLHLTINVVPSMMDQLDAYAQGKARETYAALALRRAADLDEREKRFLLRSYFQLPWKQMIFPYPRYRELLDRRGVPDADGEFAAALKRYSVQDYRDLQVWYNLSWCGNELRRNPAIAELLRRGREFTEEDKARLFQLQAEFIGLILPLYRRLAEEHGQEISVSPYYHPILPLLIDGRSAREATTDIALPPHPFTYPGDAREHVLRSQRRYQEAFGRAPQGMWPSEGSVSEAASMLLKGLGFRWLATDEGVLANSLRKSGRGGSNPSLAQRCRPWRYAGGPAMFFRDHALSDLIGFTYSQWSAEEAVGDFLNRLKGIHDSLPDDGRRYVVPVVLDGENAWEHYPRNGADFLGLLYRRLVAADFLRTVTFSEYLDLEPASETLESICAGSWIYSCLTTWIGHPEKNAAWEALTAARQVYARHEREQAGPGEARDRAFREVMIAEGSDWFWWYGDDHQTENAAEFDTLFRSHLKNIYRLLGETTPASLDLPIKKADVRTQFRNPVHTISPQLDGKVTNYFEWLSAGFATPAGGGSMHRVVRHLEKVYFGYDTNRFYLRMDFDGGLRKLPPHASVQVHFLAPRECNLIIDRSSGSWGVASFSAPASDQAPAASGDKILEIGVPLDLLGVEGPEEVRFFTVLAEDDRELERFPSTGFLVVPVTPAGLNEQEWMV